MDVKLVAFESLGIRSMCTFVRTPDLSVIIDPSVACHARSGLKPHPIEYETSVRKRAKILSFSKETDAIVTSHYHLDHLSPHETDLVTTFSTKRFANEIYTGKVLFCKDPTRNVIYRQAVRGIRFHDIYGKKAVRYEVADGNSFTSGGTKISFSEALWHGKEGTVQGYVIGTCINDDEATVVHASDVQLLNRCCVDWMLGQKPDLAVVAGPPIFDGQRVGDDDRKFSIGLLGRLTNAIPEVVVDHHLLRAADWRQFLGQVGNGVKCAAEKEGRTPRTYESGRAGLYDREEVDSSFHALLQKGRMPNRLSSVVYELGMEEVYETTLGW